MTDVYKTINSISDLLTLPDVVSRINELIRDPGTSASDITNVISQDISLSAKVLKLVNSSFYGFNRQITSINYAIVILGFNAIRNLAISAFMFDLYKSDIEGFNSHEFWKFSINSAAASQIVAEAGNHPKCEDAFMAGLMHDVGIVIMSQYFTDDFKKAMKLANEKNISFLEAQREILDYDHHEVGAALLDKWNLPVEMIEVCKNSTKPEDNDEILCSIVHIADTLARGMLLGNPGDRKIPELSVIALEKASITEDQLPQIMRDIAKKAQHTDAFLAIGEE